jgi:hypothetical protein
MALGTVIYNHQQAGLSRALHHKTVYDLGDRFGDRSNSIATQAMDACRARGEKDENPIPTFRWKRSLEHRQTEGKTEQVGACLWLQFTRAIVIRRRYHTPYRATIPFGPIVSFLCWGLLWMTQSDLFRCSPLTGQGGRQDLASEM